ncbi:uncharacterized protein VTP21DRAFT_10790 [Calcarisporiella thermophila]|uniref:uncharacterized protein n=1 Tax=Calcarisporiella thermophila TaxID=911321 RepID=UPI0037436205
MGLHLHSVATLRQFPYFTLIPLILRDLFQTMENIPLIESRGQKRAYGQQDPPVKPPLRAKSPPEHGLADKHVPLATITNRQILQPAGKPTPKRARSGTPRATRRSDQSLLLSPSSKHTRDDVCDTCQKHSIRIRELTEQLREQHRMIESLQSRLRKYENLGDQQDGESRTMAREKSEDARENGQRIQELETLVQEKDEALMRQEEKIMLLYETRVPIEELEEARREKEVVEQELRETEELLQECKQLLIELEEGQAQSEAEDEREAARDAVGHSESEVAL